jgi:acyl-CoA reductase-like NAD-dependent aldehyde dehydrogenase
MIVTRNIKTMQRMVGNIQANIVLMSTTSKHYFDMLFGVYKQFAIGGEDNLEALQEMTLTKAVRVKL